MKKQLYLIGLFLAVSLLAHSPWLGDGMLISQNDMMQQQLPFYLDGYEKFHQGVLPMWGFNNFLGVNYLGANSFYFAFSPFFWLSLVFPKLWLPTVMFALNILKLTLAATTMSWLLQTLRVKRFWLLAIGGLCYAFSGPLIMNYWFNHFNDFLCLVPLFFIAMEWLIQRRRSWPMAIAVAASAIINVYFCLGLSLISFFYYVWRTGLAARKQLFFAWYEWLEQIVRYLGLYAIGIGIAAFAFVPTVFVLLSNPRIGATSTVADWSVIGQNWAHIWSAFLLPPVTMKIHPFLVNGPFAKSGVWQSLTASVSAVALLACFQAPMVFAKKIWLSALGGVAGIFLILAIPFTNQLLAGFGNVTYRSLYLVSFFVITFAIVTLDRCEKISRRLLLVGCVVLLGGIGVTSGLAYVSIRTSDAIVQDHFWRTLTWSIGPTVIWVVLSGICFLGHRRWREIALTAIVIVTSMTQFSYFMHWSGNKNPSYVEPEQIKAVMARTQAYEQLQAQLKSDEILWRFASDFRNDGSDYFAYNQGLAYQLNTPHIYHSLYATTTNDLYNFLHGLDTPKDAYWQRYWVRSFKYNRLTHWLLGVKYTLASSRALEPLPSSEWLQTTPVGELYQLPNQFAKTYRYTIDPETATHIPWVLRDLVANEAFISGAPAGLEPYPLDERIAEGEALLRQAVAQSPNVTQSETALEVNGTGFLHVPFQQQSGELYVSNLAGMSIYRDGQLYEPKNDEAHYMQAKTVAIPITPETKRVSLQLPTGTYPLWENLPTGWQLFFADALTFAPEQVEQSLPVYHANEWSQSIRVATPQTIVFPVAYDQGWRVESDGESMPVRAVQGGLIGVDLPVGTHELAFTYTTPGLKIGVFISSVSIVGVVGGSWSHKRRHLRGKRR